MTPRFELTAPAERDHADIFFDVEERHGLPAERVSNTWTVGDAVTRQFAAFLVR